MSNLDFKSFPSVGFNPWQQLEFVDLSPGNQFINHFFVNQL